jgi:hypothetical protein
MSADGVCKMGVMARLHNFNAGPAVLPAPVLERVQSELIELPGCGASVMELSHRSKEFEAIVQNAESRLKSLLGLGDAWRVLFLTGGASQQFAQAPMNLLGAHASAQRGADYLITGDWGVKAHKEAGKFGAARVAATAKSGGFKSLPQPSETELDPRAAYVHFTSNETIQGVQWAREPESNGVPLVCDASSDILSRPIDAGRYGLVYAGAQKNVGPSGVTIVLLRPEFLPPASHRTGGHARLPRASQSQLAVQHAADRSRSTWSAWSASGLKARRAGRDARARAPSVGFDLQRDRQLGWLLHRPRRARGPLTDERDVPPGERGAGKAVSGRSEGAAHDRPARPPRRRAACEPRCTTRCPSKARARSPTSCATSPSATARTWNRQSRKNPAPASTCLPRGSKYLADSNQRPL